MAQSAFKVTSGKRIPDTVQSNCLSGAHLTIVEPVQDATRISDEVLLKYPGPECPGVGDIIRFNPSSNPPSYTLANAHLDDRREDPEELAEAIGVLESVNPACHDGSPLETTGTVVYFGKIDFSNHMGNKSLTQGRVYYLADTYDDTYDYEADYQYRNGTLREPAKISKPVYIATGPDSAVVTNFRGLMGGLPDRSGDELVVDTECRPYGFLITLTNTGSRDWNAPLTKMEVYLNSLDGSEVGKGDLQSDIMWIQADPGIIDEEQLPLAGFLPDEDPFAFESGPFLLKRGKENSKQFILGWKTLPKIGNMEILFFTQGLDGRDRVKHETVHRCVPYLELTPRCRDDEDPAQFQIRHYRPDGGVNPTMVAPINYIIQEWDKNQLIWKELLVEDGDNNMIAQGSFQLPHPNEDNNNVLDTYHASPIQDAVGSPGQGLYRIQFTNIDVGHWAYDGSETMLRETELDCVVEGDCLCDTPETHCFVFPHDDDLRLTYGPHVDEAYDESGLVPIGSPLANPEAFPQLFRVEDDSGRPYDVVGGTLIKKDVWGGTTAKQTDGQDTNLCGTVTGEPDALDLNFSFTIPDDVGICIPKQLKSAGGGGGTPWSIYIWKNEYMEQIFPDAPYIQLDFGDTPINPTDTVTILLDYNGVSFDNCISVPLKDGKYYINSELGI